MPPPNNLRQVRQFIGLCNFFRNHIKDFALISQPLHRLTRKSTVFKPGPIPDDALKAFHLIRNALISEPVVAFPRADQKFALISEPHMPSEHQEGCLSASLCQIDEQGAFHVLSHASRQFKDHEASYPPFLIDMANALYGMDAFHQYLRGQPFILYMDERPQPDLSHLHKKTMPVFMQLHSNTTLSSRTRLDPEYRCTFAPRCHPKSTPWLRTIRDSYKPRKKIPICNSSNNSARPHNGHQP